MSAIRSAKGNTHFAGIASTGPEPNKYTNHLLSRGPVQFYSDMTRLWVQWIEKPTFSFIGVRL